MRGPQAWHGQGWPQASSGPKKRKKFLVNIIKSAGGPVKTKRYGLHKRNKQTDMEEKIIRAEGRRGRILEAPNISSKSMKKQVTVRVLWAFLELYC